MMNTYSIDKIQDFMRTIYCMSIENFEEMYKAIGFKYSSYIQEKFAKKNSDMFGWFCELSPDKIEEMMEFINQK